MAMLRNYLFIVVLFVYVEGLYIAEDRMMAPMSIQVYKGDGSFGAARLTRHNIDYTRTAGLQPEQTVIVVPNQGTRQPYGYGTYGNNANRGPTVIVSNTPDQYNRVITDPYRRY